jgi:hypothetical protein
MNSPGQLLAFVFADYPVDPGGQWIGEQDENQGNQRRKEQEDNIRDIDSQ